MSSPTTNSQPLDYAPTSPKLDPNALESTTDMFTNETMPEMAVATTSKVTIDTKVITRNRTKRRISGDGRKEEKEICTMFEDTKEEVRGEEETGGEEEAKTG